MNSYVLGFHEIDKAKLMLVGGKGLNLGELSRIEGLQIPDGFCVTTRAYKRAIGHNQEYSALLDQLSLLEVDDRENICEISKKIRKLIEETEIGEDIEDDIARYLSELGERCAYAIRSSATAEDLPHASFAGQQDTYLNIKGRAEILRHIVQCWASLFTDRAVTYRIQNGFDHRKVFLAVIVQKMVMSVVSGIMFTADPMTSDRKTLSIDAGFGLGEALVSGLVNPDIYKVQDGKIVAKMIGAKKLEIRPAESGGTQKMKIESHRQKKQVLPDEQIVRLAAIGKTIEAHFGCPQDIEWCYSDGQFQIVQSRPITTLFPIPKAADPRKPRVFMSVGHLQMMTDAIKPLGISFFEPLAGFTLDKAGGRVFADITHDLSSFMGRKRLVMATGKQDPLIQSAVKKLLKDKAFMASLPRGQRNLKGGIFTISSLMAALTISKKNDPSIIGEMLAEFEHEVTAIEQQLAKLSGEQVFEFIAEDHEKMLAMAYNPKMLGAITAALLVSDSINKKVEKWLGEKNVVDILARSVDHNVTTEMGLALCNVADIARDYPAVLEYLAEEPVDDNFFEELAKLPGGKETGKAFKAFLDKYGMRCPGEIDITQARWEEKPTQLIPILLTNINVLKPGEHVARLKDGRLEAEKKEEEIISHLEKMPGGSKKAKKMRKSISLLRNFIGCREYPKYYIVRRFHAYKKALWKEAARLVEQGVLKDREDIFYLYFDELYRVIKTRKANYSIIEQRKADYILYKKLTPPRIITSEGFVPAGDYSTGSIPTGALAGIPVSSGVVEGRARVISSVDEARLEEGDILVTQFTDPSWTPLFVTIKGLVTEVGGFTTHGAVITREYGLPAVVGVQNATKLIKDGHKISVNGTKGYVEILG